jgi:predicted acyl esterase
MSYKSDPANPVPYRHRPIQPTYGEGSLWSTWLTEDQNFVTGRKDLAVWKLPPLGKDMVVTGEVLADIFAATSGTDTDIVVKLIDQYPETDADATMRGYQLMWITCSRPGTVWWWRSRAHGSRSTIAIRRRSLPTS